MLADDRSAAHVQGRRKPTIHTERLSARGSADDIDDSVYRANFMKMDLFNGDGMNSGFGLAQQLEGADGAGFHRFRERGRANDGENCRQVTMRRVHRMSFMRVLRPARRLVRRNHVHFGCGQAAPAHLAHLKACAHTERDRRFFKTGEGNACIHQGAQQHVAAYAGKTLQISNTHRFVILNCRLCSAPGKDIGGENYIH